MSLIPAVTSAAEPPGINRFLYALGQVESGGNYYARNSTSGAYGKYQIIPSSWRAWAKAILGSANAPKTPANQETVARSKIHFAFHKVGSWRVVAYWWLTGRTTRNEARWSSFARGYVNKIMKIYNRTATPPTVPPATPPEGPPDTTVAPPPELIRYQETFTQIDWSGPWGSAMHRRYAGPTDTVRWANEAGASASFPFTGKSVAWMGPKGPTRGRARVFVDGAHVATIDLRARRFQPVNTLYKASWPESGNHVLVVVVLGTKGRPTVAIDEFKVGK